MDRVLLAQQTTARDEEIEKDLWQCGIMRQRSSEPKMAWEFLARLRKNRRLLKACQSVKKAGVVLFLGKEFEARSCITVDYRAADKEIIRFLAKQTDLIANDPVKSLTIGRN